MNDIMYREANEGLSLRAKSNLYMKSFKGFHADYDTSPWLALVAEMEEYDSRIKTRDIRNFFYNDIARCALNAKCFSKAVGYAKAALALNLGSGDSKGINVSLTLLCDISAGLKDYTSALSYYEKSHPDSNADNDRTYKVLFLASLQQDIGRADVLDSEELPMTYKLIHQDFEASVLIENLAYLLGESEQSAKRFLN